MNQGDRYGLIAEPLHFFISYSRQDEDIAERIAWWIEDAGFTTCIQKWDFRPGQNFALCMHAALDRANHVLLVLSPSYLESVYPLSEMASVFASDPTGSARRMIPVRVAECHPSGLLKPIIYIDLVPSLRNGDHLSARRILLEGLRPGRAKPDCEPMFTEVRTQVEGGANDPK
jgi:hypothetical protein